MALKLSTIKGSSGALPKAPKLSSYKPMKMKLGKIKKMMTKTSQFYGPKTTSMANAEGRLKIAAGKKRKALKIAVKKASTKKKSSKVVPGLV
jgi:hypothetical protein